MLTLCKDREKGFKHSLQIHSFPGAPLIKRSLCVERVKGTDQRDQTETAGQPRRKSTPCASPQRQTFSSDLAHTTSMRAVLRQEGRRDWARLTGGQGGHNWVVQALPSDHPGEMAPKAEGQRTGNINPPLRKEQGEQIPHREGSRCR